MSGVHSKERPEIPGHDASSKGMRGFGFSSSLLTWRIEAFLSILSSFSFTQPSHSTNIFSTYDTFNTYSGFQWPGKITSSSSPRLEFASILSAALGAPPPTSRIPAPTAHASRPWDPGNSSTATSTGTLHLSSTTTLDALEADKQPSFPCFPPLGHANVRCRSWARIVHPSPACSPTSSS